MKRLWCAPTLAPLALRILSSDAVSSRLLRSQKSQAIRMQLDYSVDRSSNAPECEIWLPVEFDASPHRTMDSLSYFASKSLQLLNITYKQQII